MYIRNMTASSSDHKFTFLNRISLDKNEAVAAFANYDLAKYDTLRAQLLHTGGDTVTGPWESIHAGSTAFVEIPIHVQDLTNGEFVLQFEYSANDTEIKEKHVRLLLWELYSSTGVVGGTAFNLTKRVGSTAINFIDGFTAGNYDAVTYVSLNNTGDTASPFATFSLVQTAFNEYAHGFEPTSGHVPTMEFNPDHQEVRVAISLYKGTKNGVGAVPDIDLHNEEKWVELSILYDSFLHADFAEITQATWSTVSF